MPNTIRYNIESGAPPFVAELIGSSIPNKTYDELGTKYFNNVSNGVYTLRVTDGNGCIFENQVIVDPFVTTTTTTVIPSDSIIVGNTQDPITIFNVNSTNRNSKYQGFPETDVVRLFLWFRTFDGKPLTSSKVIEYTIGVTGGTADSNFIFNSVSDEVHTEVQQGNVGPNSSIVGDLILKPGFIETYVEYTYLKGSTNNDFAIDLTSATNDFYPNLETKTEAGKTYGIDVINSNQIRLNY